MSEANNMSKNDSVEAMKLALEALQWFTAAEPWDEPDVSKAIKALEAALEAHKALAQSRSDVKQDQCDCKDPSQCWEPCGELGKSEAHAKVYQQEQGEPVAWTPRIERIYKDGVLVEQTIQYNPQGQKLPYPHEPSLPVGKVILYTGEGFACAPFHKIEWSDGMMPPAGTQLYTTPQQRKPLTDEQIDALDVAAIHGGPDSQYGIRFARAIEAAHGIKE